MAVGIAAMVRWPNPVLPTSAASSTQAPLSAGGPASTGSIEPMTAGHQSAPDPGDEFAPSARAVPGHGPALGPGADGVARIEVTVVAMPPAAGPEAGTPAVADPAGDPARTAPSDAPPLPHVEVGLLVAPAEHASGERGAVVRAFLRTDEHGVAVFEVPGGHGRAAEVRCGLGAAAALTLAATEPVRVVLTIRPRVLVTGKVVDAAGTGVADATLVLLPWQASGWQGGPGGAGDAPAPWRVGRSGADGSFTIGLGVGGRIGAHHRVHGPSAMYPVRAGAKGELPTATLQLVLLSAPSQIAGTVRDVHGRPIADAELEFRSADAPPSGAELKSPPVRTRTDADGYYTATRVAPGTVAFGVRARGHGPRTGTLRVQPGASLALDHQLPDGCSLTGTVRDGQGAALAATVLAGPAAAFTCVRGNTAADGSFVLHDLAPGATLLAAVGAPGRRFETTLDLRPGHDNEWHAVLSGGAPASNLRGVLVDGRDAPLAGWRIRARVGRGSGPASVTGADGSFALAVLPDVAVDLRAYAPGRPDPAFADGVWRNVAAGDTVVRLQLPAPTFGRVEGRVATEALGGVPAKVACWHHEREEYVETTAANDGTLMLTHVPAGTLDLLFEHPGHAAVPRRDLLLTPHQPLELGTVVLGSGGALFGNVRGLDGQAPADCELVVIAGKERFHGTYLGGTYRFAALPTGTHALLVQALGHAGARFTITVHANTEQQRDVLLLAGVPRTIRVVLPANAPAMCGLAIQPADGAAQWLALRGSTHATGTAHRTAAHGGERNGERERSVEFVACMAPGTYRAVAWAVGGWEASAPVTFVFGDDSELRLVLQQRPR